MTSKSKAFASQPNAIKIVPRIQARTEVVVIDKMKSPQIETAAAIVRKDKQSQLNSHREP
jgi:hypothetical protein